MLGHDLFALGLSMLLMAGASAVWAWGDAEMRGRPGWAVALLVLLGWWPLGLLAWIVFRPQQVLYVKPGLWQSVKALGLAPFQAIRDELTMLLRR